MVDGTGLSNLSRYERLIVAYLERGWHIDCERCVIMQCREIFKPISASTLRTLIRKGVLNENMNLIPGYRKRIREKAWA